MELPAEVEVSILPGRKLREVDRVVGGDEAWHACLDRSLEEGRLRVHDHVPESRQSGDDAGSACASRRHFGLAAQINTRDRRAERL